MSCDNTCEVSPTREAQWRLSARGVYWGLVMSAPLPGIYQMADFQRESGWSAQTDKNLSPHSSGGQQPKINKCVVGTLPKSKFPMPGEGQPCKQAFVGSAAPGLLSQLSSAWEPVRYLIKMYCTNLKWYKESKKKVHLARIWLLLSPDGALACTPPFIQWFIILRRPKRWRVSTPNLSRI